MKKWISNHISDLNQELRMINKELKRLINKRSIIKRKIKMFNKVLNNTDETEQTRPQRRNGSVWNNVFIGSCINRLYHRTHNNIDVWIEDMK